MTLIRADLMKLHCLALTVFEKRPGFKILVRIFKAAVCEIADTYLQNLVSVVEPVISAKAFIH